MHWYCLRDLTRPNAKRPGYELLREAGLEVFTPMRWTVVTCQGRKVKRQQPVLHDLLFVRGTREQLDPYIAETPTLQYRYVKGRPYRDPLTIDTAEMDRFIAASQQSKEPRYYLPEELGTLHFGKRIRIISDDILNGYEAELLSIRGGRKKKILVRLPGLLAVEYELHPSFIEFL